MRCPCRDSPYNGCKAQRGEEKCEGNDSAALVHERLLCIELLLELQRPKNETAPCRPCSAQYFIDTAIIDLRGPRASAPGNPSPQVRCRGVPGRGRGPAELVHAHAREVRRAVAAVDLPPPPPTDQRPGPRPAPALLHAEDAGRSRRSHEPSQHRIREWIRSENARRR